MKNIILTFVRLVSGTAFNSIVLSNGLSLHRFVEAFSYLNNKHMVKVHMWVMQTNLQYDFLKFNMVLDFNQL